jgi:transketolase
MFPLGFEPEALSEDHLARLRDLRAECAGDILAMTTLAGCGHPGGSLSSLDFLMLLYANCRIDRNDTLAPDRDRVIVSHGHISPGVYGVLGNFGFADREDIARRFRRFGSPFGGHVEISVPGVEWNSGNLGQGLSAGVGSALGARLSGADPSKDLREQTGSSYRVIVAMGDGEQQKGQISEARRLAVKYGCNNLIGIVDVNSLQIGGACDDIMPQQIAAGWASDGWNVIEVDGHDMQALYAALRAAYRNETERPERPTVLLARTIMSKGVPFMENLAKWHGNALKPDQCKEAIAHLGAHIDLDRLIAERAALPEEPLGHHFPDFPVPDVVVGPPKVYSVDTKTDCRSAYGAVMADVAERNNTDSVKVVAFSADLEGSVKLNAFHAAAPAAFIEGGIQEHNSATASGRLSRDGYQVYFSTFGIFGVTEVFNQQRLNGYNRTNLKLACTHCGTDVGEDGPTHQVVDYVGLLRSTFDWSIHVPGDANQCDRIVRWSASQTGNHFIGMGRSKWAQIAKLDGTPFYDGTVGYTPGEADVLREGDDGAILAVGPMVRFAVQAHDSIFEATGKRVRIVNMASLRPVDADAIRAAASTGYILTCEDHHPDTGLGGIVAGVLADSGLGVKLERAGVDQWPMSGKPDDIFAAYRLDAAGLTARAIAVLS